MGVLNVAGSALNKTCNAAGPPVEVPIMISSVLDKSDLIVDLVAIGLLTRVGFVVDQLVGQEEVVIKPLGKMLHGTAGMAGATITGDGRIALILDIPSMLSRYATRQSSAA